MLQYVSVETLRNRRNFVRYTQCLRELRSDHHKCYEIAVMFFSLFSIGGKGLKEYACLDLPTSGVLV